jgi:murein L,D-transpeptidase YafK
MVTRRELAGRAKKERGVMRWGWSVLGAAVVVGGSLLFAVQGRSSSLDGQDGLSIYVFKQRHELLLKQGDTVLRSFQVALGRKPDGPKLFRGDNRTPEGRYYVCEKRPQSRFRRFLGISYPNRSDADRAFAERLITAEQWADIFFANLLKAVPPSTTLLGGRVGIHGHGEHPPDPFDWTEGCIAVSDAAIDYLYDVVPIGTPVVITD